VDPSKLGASAGLRGFLTGLLAPRPEDRYEDAHQAIRALYAGRKLNATSKRLMSFAIAGSAVVAMISAVLVMNVQKAARESPRVEAPIVAPVVAAPVPVAPAPTQGSAQQPHVRLTGFPWQLASWGFDKPGPWLLDTTGHRHSVPYPSNGYGVDFFGPYWDGTQRVVVPDSRSFAFATHPFHSHVSVSRLKSDDRPLKHDARAVQHLITRGDPNGRFAFDLALIGEVARFTLMDEHGRSSSIEGAVPLGEGEVSLYAQWDPDTGDQWIDRVGSCKPVAHAVTTVRPALTVPGNQVVLIDKFDGRVRDISLSRGLMLPNKPPAADTENCGFSGTRLSE
jgi:hypothetical protein